MKFKLFLTIAFLVIVFGCQKEKSEKSTSVNKISQNLYPYLFDSGSYWIYKKVGTSIIENISEVSIQKDILNVDAGIEAEYYKITYHSFLNSSNYDEYLIGYTICKCLGPRGFLLLTSKEVGDKVENAEIINVLDSMMVENRSFKNVIKMKVLKDNCMDKNYYLYYVDNIGMIKKEIFDSISILETWNLTNFNIKLLKTN